MTLAQTSPTTPVATLRRELGRWKFDLLREAAAAVYSCTEIGPKLVFSRASRRSRVPLPTAQQAMLRWSVLPPHVNTLQQFLAELAEREIHYAQGRHTVYIPPQESLASMFGDLVRYYPDNSGFKVLKRFGMPETTHYLHDKHARWITAGLMGGIRGQVDAANLLYALGLGPRLHDFIELNSATTQMTCFVVEHVSGDTPTPGEHGAFVSQLTELLSNDLRNAVALATPRKLRHRDFASPDCNGNLLKSRVNQRLQYVDFQPFMVIDRRRIVDFVFSRLRVEVAHGLLTDTRSVPPDQPPAAAFAAHQLGAARTWAAIQRLLAAQGISVRERLVLDPACRLGLLLDSALESGASWGIGWTHPDAVECIDRMQCLWGNTRLTLLPAQVGRGHRLAEDVPNGLQRGLGEAVVLDVGAGPAWDLGALPWRVLIQARRERSQVDVDQASSGRLVAEVQGEHWLGMYVRD